MQGAGPDSDAEVNMRSFDAHLLAVTFRHCLEPLYFPSVCYVWEPSCNGL
jgi:hypothetical protein